MSSFQRAFKCPEELNGCGHIGVMVDGKPPDCCPKCGSLELMYGAARVLPDGSTDWKMHRRFQNPAASYIPFALQTAKRVKDLPWRVSGAKILLAMLRGEEKVKEVKDAATGEAVLGADGKPVKIVVPYTPGHMGEESERTKGIVVGFGAGEMTQSGGWISPEHDYGIYLGAIVLISPSSGNPVNDGLASYRSITIWDIEAVLDPKYGKAVYERLRSQAQSDLERYQTDHDEVGFDAEKIPKATMRQSPEDQLAEAIEESRRLYGGDKTTSSFLVQGLKSQS